MQQGPGHTLNIGFRSLSHPSPKPEHTFSLGRPGQILKFHSNLTQSFELRVLKNRARASIATSVVVPAKCHFLVSWSGRHVGLKLCVKKGQGCGEAVLQDNMGRTTLTYLQSLGSVVFQGRVFAVQGFQKL